MARLNRHGGIIELYRGKRGTLYAVMKDGKIMYRDNGNRKMSKAKSDVFLRAVETGAFVRDDSPAANPDRKPDIRGALSP